MNRSLALPRNLLAAGTRMSRPVRFARIVVLAIVIGIGIGDVYWSAAQWHMKDAGAYWEAAMRLRNGLELYPAVTNVEASEVYRYAPWFAWLTIPFTFLPVQVAGAIWSAILLVASTLAVVPLARSGAWLAVAFFWPILVGISASGNVHALMIAMLVWGVERRSGPMWVAIAASLKAFPILYALVYLGRREWGRAALSVALAAMLVAPIFLYDLSHYVTTSGFAGLLIAWPPIYVATLALGMVLTLILARGKWSWLTASTTVSLALPRFFVYDVTFLMVGAAPTTRALTAPSGGGGVRHGESQMTSGDSVGR
jgi:hypothetical protein